MDTQNLNEELMDREQVKLLLKSVYNLDETEVSKAEMALFHKMMEIDARIKRLEEHFLVPIIHKDM